MAELFDKDCDIVLQLEASRKKAAFIHCFRESVYFPRIYIAIVASKKNGQSIFLYLHGKS